MFDTAPVTIDRSQGNREDMLFVAKEKYGSKPQCVNIITHAKKSLLSSNSNITRTL